MATYSRAPAFGMAAPDTVVAIDFGTTRSACGYQVRGEADDKVLVRLPGTAAASPSSTMKTETVALIGGHGRGDLMSFGPAALDEYAEGDHSADQALFRWFKIDLCQPRPGHTSTDRVMTESTGGHTVPLLGVMTASLKYFMEDVLGFLSSTAGRTVRPTSINWVVTVPAIYDDFAKRFMREAAFFAGMIDRVNSPKLRLCLEPEAACLAATKDNPLTNEAEGKKMMIIDCGGGTVDITAHEVVSVEPLVLEEVSAPDGGLFGSTRVDDEFKAWLKTFLGNKFAEVEHSPTLVSIMKHWESKKSTFEGEGLVRLKLSELASEVGMSKQDVEDARTRYNAGKALAKRVTGNNFMVNLPATLVTSFFTPTLQKIGKCLRRIRHDSSLRNLHRVYVVGGFSRCPLLREVVKAELDQPGCSVVQVHEPDVTIVKGAVMYFDKSTVFNSRKARLTYGTDVSVPYDSNNAEHRRRRDAGQVSENALGVLYVNHAFDVFIKEGDDLPVGGVLERHSRIPLTKDQAVSSVVVYATSDRSPSFVSERGCFEVGRVSISHDTTKEREENAFRIEFTFGGPELTVKILHRTEEREIADAVMTMSRAPHAANIQS